MELGEQAIRQAAMTMQQLAEQVRAIGAQALAESASGWHSSAGERYRQQLAGHAAAIRDCAGRLQHAADLLRRHADRCHQVQHWLPRPW